VVGSRVGTLLSSLLGSAVGGADDEGVSTVSPMILIIGDSNAIGQAVTDKADPAFNVTSPITQITYDKHYSQAASDPPVFSDLQGSLQPYSIGGTAGLGFQISLGQAVLGAGLRPVMVEMAVSGTSCAQWQVASGYPTTGPSLYNLMVTRVHALETQYRAKVAAVVVVLGGNDGANTTDANNLQANTLATATALRSSFGATIPIIWNKININTNITNLATIRSQQAAAFVADPNITPIDNDDLGLLTDFLHFNAESYIALGHRMAFAILDKLLVARARPLVFPRVVGFGPASYGPSNNTPYSWGGSLNGDLEILAVYTLTAAGTNNAITTPSGWTLISGTSTTSAGSGSTTRVAFYSRAVTTTMLNANGGHTAATTVTSANTINSCRIFTVRGPNLSPTVDLGLSSVNNAFQTGLSLSAITTTAANENVVIIAGGFRTNFNQNPMVVTGSVASLTDLEEANRDNGDSNFITIACWDSTLAAAGSTGAVTCTFSLATLAAGVLLGIKP
jgi:hypothetical protein